MGLTFGSMVGGLKRTEGVSRWDQYGDVRYREREWFQNAATKNQTVARVPQNERFREAVAAATRANPEVNGYTWTAAIRLLGAKRFADEPVAMVVEVQLYLEQFLTSRKGVHCYYKITRASHLASLAQDCRKYALNTAIAYSRQKELERQNGGGSGGSAGTQPK